MALPLPRAPGLLLLLAFTNCCVEDMTVTVPSQKAVHCCVDSGASGRQKVLCRPLVPPQHQGWGHFPQETGGFQAAPWVDLQIPGALIAYFSGGQATLIQTQHVGSLTGLLHSMDPHPSGHPKGTCVSPAQLPA